MNEYTSLIFETRLMFETRSTYITTFDLNPRLILGDLQTWLIFEVLRCPAVNSRLCIDILLWSPTLNAMQ
jgi:hypothetical protein